MEDEVKCCGHGDGECCGGKCDGECGCKDGESEGVIDAVEEG